MTSHEEYRQEPNHQQSPDYGNRSPQRAVQARRWANDVEQQIAEAHDRGEFDNLPGQGQPLRQEVNPLAKEKALAYGLLKNNHMAPPEIERGKEIDEELKQSEVLLARLRRYRDELRARTHVFASDRRSYSLLLENTERRYAKALAAINSKILSLNIIAPPDFHRRIIDVEAKLRDFHAEFVWLPPDRDS